MNYKYENFFLQNHTYKISLNHYNFQIDLAAIETAWKALLAVFLTKFWQNFILAKWHYISPYSHQNLRRLNFKMWFHFFPLRPLRHYIGAQLSYFLYRIESIMCCLLHLHTFIIQRILSLHNKGGKRRKRNSKIMKRWPKFPHG